MQYEDKVCEAEELSHGLNVRTGGIVLYFTRTLNEIKVCEADFFTQSPCTHQSSLFIEHRKEDSQVHCLALEV